MKSKINTGKITGKVRIRILRPWRGYAVGAVIKPPGALAQIVLQTKDQLGNPVAEQVLEPEPESAQVLEPTPTPTPTPTPELEPEPVARHGAARSRKGEPK